MEALKAFNRIWRRIFSDFNTFYLVGGSVPAILQGKIPNDLDIASSKQPDVLIKTFKTEDHIDVLPTGVEYGTVTFRFFHEGETYSFEHTTFRKDLEYTPTGRCPVIDFGSSIYQDLERRDFTVNAMAYDLNHADFVDPENGLSDLERGILRWVGDPVIRIGEDPLRIMRLFITREKYDLEYENPLTPQTFRAFATAFEQKVSAERVYQHLYKIFSGFSFQGIQRILEDIRTLCPWILYAPGQEGHCKDAFEGLPEGVNLSFKDIPHLPDLYLMLFLNKVLPYLRKDLLPVIPGTYYKNKLRLEKVGQANLWELKQLYNTERYRKNVISLELIAQLTGRTSDLKSHRVSLENPAFEGYEVAAMFPETADAAKRGKWIAEVGQLQMTRPEGESITDFKTRIKEEFNIE